MPEDVYRIVSEVKAKLPDARLGIHAHNDTEQAVAVSLAAVRAGARQIQGTLNGLGERCGNANLCSLLPNLMLKEPYASQFETGVSFENLDTAHPCLAAAGRDPQPRARPPRGLCRSVGLRAQGRPACPPRWPKDPRTYEHVPPETVGNKRTMLVSDQSGPLQLLARLRNGHRYRRRGQAAISPDCCEDVKQREFLGYCL